MLSSAFTTDSDMLKMIEQMSLNTILRMSGTRDPVVIDDLVAKANEELSTD